MDSISIRGYLVVAYLERSVLTLSNFFRCFYLVREFSKSVLQIIYFFKKILHLRAVLMLEVIQ